MFQTTITGLISGLILAVLALGFQMVYMPAKTLHLAAAGIYAVAPYIAFSVYKITNSWLLSIITSLFVTAIISMLCELLNHRKLEYKKASNSTHMISSLAISIILIQTIAMIWGNEDKSLRNTIDTVWNLEYLVITKAQWIGALLAGLILISSFVWLKFTSFGIRLRALSDNPTEFALQGFNVHYYRLLAFLLSGLFVCSASLLSAYDVGFSPYSGMNYLLLAIVATIVGGKKSFLGPVVGGLLIGIVRAEVVWFASARWQDVITFILLAIVLYVRPQGICAVKSRLETE